MSSPMTPLPPPTPADPKPPDPATPYEEKVSFAAALAKPKLRPRFQPIPLPNRQYGSLDGKPRISFTTAELDAGAKVFQFSLIAKFTVGRPTIDIIRRAFQANWDIKGRATLSEIWDARHLLIILDSEEDMIAAMTCPLRKVQHAMFRLFRYSADYNPKRESTVAVKWLRLPGLPPPLFHRNYIGAIINSFADFLDVDDRTKACATMRYARACAEIDVTHSIPHSVWIDLPEGKGYWQEIIVEGNLAYCSHCRIHGHELSQCRKKKPAEPAAHQGPGTMKSRSTHSTAKQPELEWTEVSHKKRNSMAQMQAGYGPDILYNVTTVSNGTDEGADVVDAVSLGEQSNAVAAVSLDSSVPASNVVANVSATALPLPVDELRAEVTSKKQIASSTVTPARADKNVDQIQVILESGNKVENLRTATTAISHKNTPPTKDKHAGAVKSQVMPTIKGILKNPKPPQSSKPVATLSKDHESAVPSKSPQ